VNLPFLKSYGETNHTTNRREDVPSVLSVSNACSFEALAVEISFLLR